MHVRELEGGGRKVRVAAIPLDRQQRYERRQRGMDRVAAALRVRDVARGALHRQGAIERSAPAVLYRVAQSCGRGRLADDAGVDRATATLQRIHDRCSPIDGIPLFVGSEEQGDRPWMRRLSGDQALDRGDHGRHRCLHVRGATPVQVAVPLRGNEWIGRPAVDRSRRHDVDVSGQADERRRAPAARPQVAHSAPVHALAFESRGGEAGSNEIEAAVIGRRNRAAGYQLSRECNSFVRYALHAHSRSSSLIDVFALVCASTRLTMTAHASEQAPSAEGRLPGTTTDPAGTRP